MFNVHARLRSVPRQPNPQGKEQHQENSRSSLPFSFSPCSLIKSTKTVSEMLSGTTLKRLWYHIGTTLEGGSFAVKRAISRNFRYPSAELREKVCTAVKERGSRPSKHSLLPLASTSFGLAVSPRGRLTMTKRKPSRESQPRGASVARAWPTGGCNSKATVQFEARVASRSRICPKAGHWHAMEIAGERNDFRTRVEHYPPNPAFTSRIGEYLQAVNVANT